MTKTVLARVALAAVLLCLLVYFAINRPGRFQVASLHPRGFVVLDTATGSLVVHERSVITAKWEEIHSEGAASVEYRLRLK